MKRVDDKLKLRQILPCVEALPPTGATQASQQLPSVVLPSIPADHPEAIATEIMPAMLNPYLYPPPRPGA